MKLSQVLSVTVGDPAAASLTHRLFTAAALCSAVISSALLPPIVGMTGYRPPTFWIAGLTALCWAIYVLARMGWRPRVAVWLYLGANCAAICFDWRIAYGREGLALPVTVALLTITPLIVPRRDRVSAILGVGAVVTLILLAGAPYSRWAEPFSLGRGWRS